MSLAKKITAAIREVDPETPILVNSSGWAYPQLFEALRPTGDPRTVYTVHFYDPHYYTHQKPTEKVVYPGFRVPGKQDGPWDKAALEARFAPVRAFQQKHHVPIFVGEFGCARYAPGAEAMASRPDGPLRAIRLVLGLLGLPRVGCHEHRAHRRPQPTNRIMPTPPLLRLFKTYFAKDKSFFLRGSRPHPVENVNRNAETTSPGRRGCLSLRVAPSAPPRK